MRDRETRTERASAPVFILLASRKQFEKSFTTQTYPPNVLELPPPSTDDCPRTTCAMNDLLEEALAFLHLSGALIVCAVLEVLPSMVKVLNAGGFAGTSLAKGTIEPFCDVLKLHLPNGDITEIAGLEFFSGKRLTEIKKESREAEQRVLDGSPVDWLDARNDLTKKQKQNLRPAVEEEYVPDKAHSTALPDMQKNRLTIETLVVVLAEGLKAISEDKARSKAMKQALKDFPRDDGEYLDQLGRGSSSSAASPLASTSAAASSLASTSAAASPLASTSAAARKPSKRARIDNDSSASTYSSTSVGNSDDEMGDGQDYSIGLKGKGKGKAEDAGQGQRERKERKAKEVGEKHRRGSKGG
ncbi:hypothetical protein JCM11641_003814 [Rhodosporidiobolus odoratus]